MDKALTHSSSDTEIDAGWELLDNENSSEEETAIPSTLQR